MKITFIGGGNMAAAIIAGLVSTQQRQIRVVDLNVERLSYLQQQFSVETLATLPDSFSRDEVVVLAVKPQQLKALCRELAPRLGGALVLSVAAGIGSEALGRWLGQQRIVRAMPNTPAMVAQGVTGLYAVAEVTTEDRQLAATIMSSVGRVMWLAHESAIDDITCISGSGPAYVFYFMESMIAVAQQLGFNAEDARALVLDTFSGAVALARQSSASIDELRLQVSSKGGTTERAIARFEAEHVKQAIIAAAEDCRLRSIEMGQQLSQE